MADKKFPLSVVISAVDKLTAPMRRINQQIEAATKPVQKLKAQFALLSKEAGLDKIAKNLGKVKSAASGLAKNLALIIGGGAVAFKKGFLDVAVEFEKFETILGTIEGSSQKAKQSMAWIGKFAASTPYELAEVTDAFVKLRAYGLDPTSGLLKTLGDTSAAMGKPIMQAVEAIADAVTGENERLKEFGIKASKIGKKIVYEYTENGKTMRKAAQAGNREMIQKTLEGIFNAKYSGAMDKLSKTWAGMVSNIQDQWARFAIMVMDSGLFEWMKNKLQLFLDKINELAASGQLQKIAEDFGSKLKKGFEAAWMAGSLIYNLVKDFVDLVGGGRNALLAFAAILAGPLLLALTQLGVVMASNPLGLIAIAFGVGYLAGKKLYEYLSKFPNLFDSIASSFKKTTMGRIFSLAAGVYDFAFNGGDPGAAAARQGALRGGVDININGQNLPSGMRVNSSATGAAQINRENLGYAMAGSY